MNKLHEYLNNCARYYYSGNPLISDHVFDALAHSCGYGSVGARQHTDVEDHLYQMYSLSKFYAGDSENGPLHEYPGKIVGTPKLDGAAIEVLYIGGALVRGLTRGDGTKGTLITDKLLATNIVPHNIDCADTVQISGEIVANKFTDNARNYAAGALALKDIAEFKTRAVEFFAYGISPPRFNTYSEDMRFLQVLGFSTVFTETNLHEVYPLDGIVYRVDSNKDFENLGYTSKHPRGAYALKERKDGIETILLDVVWQVGKSGKVTPVAILEPINIDGAIVSRASLHNMSFIDSLELSIGDTVAVIRAGEIIPQVTHKVE